MASLYPANLEGPPSPDDMDSLVRDLVFDSKHEKANSVARVMVDNYLHASSHDENERSRQFYYWLGVRSVTGMLVGRIETRRFDRQLKKGRR